MPIPHDILSLSTNFDQFMRPNSVDVDYVAARLASRGKGFADSVGQSNLRRLADTVMMALGHHINTLAFKDMCALVDL